MKCHLCNKDTPAIIANQLRSGEKKKIFYCEECSLGILDNNQSEEELKKFYDEEYRKKFKPKLDTDSNPEDLFNIYTHFQKSRMDLIKDFLSKDMKLLEIGCSAGMFLFHVKDLVKQVTGLDYDSNSANFTSEKCSCKTFTTDLDETGLKENNFDIICAFQVLEHVKNPTEFLNKVKKKSPSSAP